MYQDKDKQTEKATENRKTERERVTCREGKTEKDTDK
jgi:hypothetical protein